MMGYRRQRGNEITILDHAAGQSLPIEGARHQHVDAGDTAQRRSGGGKTLVAEPEKRIDSHEVLEWPERRDLAAGPGDRGLDGVGWSDARGAFHRQLRFSISAESNGDAHGLAPVTGAIDVAAVNRADAGLGQSRSTNRLARVLTYRPFERCT